MESMVSNKEALGGGHVGNKQTPWIQECRIICTKGHRSAIDPGTAVKGEPSNVTLIQERYEAARRKANQEEDVRLGHKDGFQPWDGLINGPVGNGKETDLNEPSANDGQYCKGELSGGTEAQDRDQRNYEQQQRKFNHTPAAAARTRSLVRRRRRP